VGVPKVIEVYERLKKIGYNFNNPPLSPEDLSNMVHEMVDLHGRHSRRS